MLWRINCKGWPEIHVTWARGMAFACGTGFSCLRINTSEWFIPLTCDDQMSWATSFVNFVFCHCQCRIIHFGTLDDHFNFSLDVFVSISETIPPYLQSCPQVSLIGQIKCVTVHSTLWHFSFPPCSPILSFSQLSLSLSPSLHPSPPPLQLTQLRRKKTDEKPWALCPLWWSAPLAFTRNCRSTGRRLNASWLS